MTDPLADEAAFASQSVPEWTNRSRTLLVTSRGVTAHQRRFVLELFNLLPHVKKEFKIDRHGASRQIRELCEHHKCKQFLFFQTRKKTHFVLYAGLFPYGPTVQFDIEDYVDSGSLRLQGNCIKGSRPILSFDGAFGQSQVLEAAQLIFGSAFNVPKFHPKSKPCVDHVFAFNVVNGNVTFRNYQIFREVKNKVEDVKQLYEIGPRMVLRPAAVLLGAMSGEVVFRAPRQPKKVRIWRGRRRDEGEVEEENELEGLVM